MLESPVLERNSGTRVQDRRQNSDRRVLTVVRWPVGGIRTHLLYNYPEAIAAGYRFTFVGPDDASFSAFSAEFADHPDSEFVPTPAVRNDCDLIPVVRSELRTNRFALMHSHGLTAAVQAAVANRKLRIPHIATVHDVLRRDQFRGISGMLKRWVIGHILRRLDTIICVGEDVRANLIEYLPGLRRHRLVVIPNGVDTSRFKTTQAPTNELRRRLGISLDVVLLGFLGRFMEQKGFLPLLDALARLRRDGSPQRFFLVAVGSGDFEREYRAEIAKRGLSDVVSMLPFVPDIAPLLRQLDLLVVPSLWEALPLLPMEAMAAGVPVLGTDCLGSREVLRDTPSRMATAGSVESLHTNLHAALANPWTEAARAYAPVARNRFDNARSARQLIELFDASVLAPR